MSPPPGKTICAIRLAIYCLVRRKIDSTDACIVDANDPSRSPIRTVTDGHGDAVALFARSRAKSSQPARIASIALGNALVEACTPGDKNGDEQITVDEILAASNNGLNGCGPIFPAFDDPCLRGTAAQQLNRRRLG
jgi:hypothetical protein